MNEIRGKRILITGYNGFIGKALTKRLVDKNEVIGIDYTQPNTDDKEFVKYKMDVSEENFLDKFKEKVDLVFHFGSPSSNELFKIDNYSNVKNSILGFINIMEYSKKASVETVVFPSSGTVYGSSTSSNTRTLDPINSYGVVKLAHEKFASIYSNFFKVRGLRIFMGYGPGEENKGDVASPVYLFLRDVLQGKSPVIWGNGEQTRDVIYIDDIIDVVLGCLGFKTDYPFFDVGTGINVSFLEILNIIRKLTNTQIEPIFISKPNGYLENTRADPTIAKAMLGRNPMPIEKGIERFLLYLTQLQTKE
ncbi:MAG: NAD-dependent epimerase/dehydratase family protein [Candidatus Parvarchaeum sp.]